MGMWEFIKEVFTNSVKNTISNAITKLMWIILSACAVFVISNSPEVYGFLADKGINQFATWLLISASGIVLSSVVTVVVKNNKNRRRPWFPTIEYEYVFEEFTFELLFRNRKEIELKSACRLRALREVCEYTRRYYWTGSGNEKPVFIDNPHRHRLFDQDDNGPGQKYKVMFATPLYAGDQTDFSVLIRCRDDALEMSPHHGFTVLKPTRKLILRLIFCDDLVDTVNMGVYTDNTADIPLGKIKQLPLRQVAGLRIYEWEITKPGLLYYYRLDWAFKATGTSVLTDGSRNT